MSKTPASAAGGAMPSAVIMSFCRAQRAKQERTEHKIEELLRIWRNFCARSTPEEIEARKAWLEAEFPSKKLVASVHAFPRKEVHHV